jgi:hypothetical protein
MAEWIELNIKEELITIIESDLPIEDGSPISESYIFYAFGPTGHVGIVALSPPAATWTLDSVVEVWSYTIDDPALNYNELSRIKTTVDGREVVIIDYQFSIPIETIGDTTVGGNNHNLWMFTLAGKTAWAIMCGTSSEMFSDYEEALHAVINSFRILCSPTTTNTYTPPPTSSIRITPTTIHIN